MSEAKRQAGDHALGMNAPIERRDLLQASLLAAGSVLMSAVTPAQLSSQEDWTGYGGVGEYALSNGNTWDVVTAGHTIRDRVFEGKPLQPQDTGEVFDCAVIGGGISGLSAALFFQRETKGKKTCLLLDNHPMFGGEAKQNEFVVDGVRLTGHQGSAACFPPLSGSYLQTFYDSIGLRWDQFQYQTWSGPKPAMPVQTTPYLTGSRTSGFFFGAKFGQPDGLWLSDPWGKQLLGAPIDEATRRELLLMRHNDHKSFVQHDGTPKTHGDEASRHLDSLTLEQFLAQHYGMRIETVRQFISPVAGGGSGLGADALSAYCEYAADVLLPWKYDEGAQMFPGGNTGVARQIMASLLPSALPSDGSMRSVQLAALQADKLDVIEQATRVRLGATVISVKQMAPENGTLEVLYTKGGMLQRVRARSAVMAGGSWTAKHILHDLPTEQREAYLQFHRAPCLMANVAVRHWRFLYDLGLTEGRWFEGFGNYIAVRKIATFGKDPKSISPDTPIVLNLKILFPHPGLPLQQQVTRGRSELYATSYREYERRIREQLTMLFGRSGFDARRDIAGIVLNRWGHAYLAPQPGFFFGAGGHPGPGDVLRQNPHGSLAFANSDLAGIMDHRMSISEAKRAVDQIKSV